MFLTPVLISEKSHINVISSHQFVYTYLPYAINNGKTAKEACEDAVRLNHTGYWNAMIEEITVACKKGEIVGGVFRQQFQNTADILVADHAEYNMQFLMQLFVYILQLLANTFKAISVVTCVADEVRIALEFLPASHQTGHLAYIRESGMVIFITDFISQVL